jgi:ElaA protein
MTIDWKLKAFNELSPEELYAILRLRSEVFVVEQNCVFLDADNKDQCSYHVMGWKENELVAYSRLVPAGISYSEPSIGRVVTSRNSRSLGLGKELMRHSIYLLHAAWGKLNIRIGAQLYLEQFYNSLGFQRTSEIYMEDGIEHIEMQLNTLS